MNLYDLTSMFLCSSQALLRVKFRVDHHTINTNVFAQIRLNKTPMKSPPCTVRILMRYGWNLQKTERGLDDR